MHLHIFIYHNPVLMNDIHTCKIQFEELVKLLYKRVRSEDLDALSYKINRVLESFDDAGSLTNLRLIPNPNKYRKPFLVIHDKASLFPNEKCHSNHHLSSSSTSADT